MVVVKILRPDNALVRAARQRDIVAAFLIVAVVCFLFEQPHLVGLSQIDVFIGAALVALVWMSMAHWRERAHKLREERKSDGPD